MNVIYWTRLYHDGARKQAQYVTNESQVYKVVLLPDRLVSAPHDTYFGENAAESEGIHE